LCCLITTTAFAEDINFIASVDRKNISINDQFQLNLIISGTQNVDEPNLPPLNDFEIVSQGSSSQFSVVNGEMTLSKTYIYTLAPIKEGTFTINPATIEIEDDSYSTDPITINVSSSQKQARPSKYKKTTQQPQATPNATGNTAQESSSIKDKIFIEISTDKEEPFIGEQVVLTFKLYFTGITIDNLEYVPPITKGFVTESMGPQKEYRTNLNGVIYNVIELKTAIFPASSGVLIVEPAKLKCDILVKQKRSRQYSSFDDPFFNNFFDNPFSSSFTRHPVKLESNSIEMPIKPLPEHQKTEFFNGAVGTYDLSIEITPETLKEGEPINLLMKISGAGNISSLPEPIIEKLNDFKSYESEIKTKITGRHNEIAGEKIFQKMIIPQNTDIKEFPAIVFSYFDPYKEQYNTIKRGPIAINVLAAPKKDTEIIELIKDIAPKETRDQSIKLLAKDIQYIKTNIGKVRILNNIWYKNILIWLVIVFVPFFLVLFTFYYKNHLTRMKENTTYAKSRIAYKTANSMLSKVKKQIGQSASKESYDIIVKTVENYLSNKLDIPKGNILIHIENKTELSQGIKTRIKSLINTCDMARFGAISFNKKDVENIYKEAVSIIKSIEKKI